MRSVCESEMNTITPLDIIKSLYTYELDMQESFIKRVQTKRMIEDVPVSDVS